ncbi:MAG: LysE/ArgO family amino acid transporter [Pseudomonas sp.]|nr:LysE/ArgO family amino acid transporter [Pseudomonas sp.]
MLMLTSYTTGFTIGLSLILAIGAQNAFVLRQGLRNEHVLLVVLVCALSDAALIFFGASSFRHILVQVPWVDPAMRYGGAAFLIWYGAKSIYSAARSNTSIVVANESGMPMRYVLATCLALTWLNPHVYLDTVVLIGTISTRFPGQEMLFASGAATASLVFFFSLGFGARYLRPVFATPKAWRILEAVIAIVMWFIALKLILGM